MGNVIEPAFKEKIPSTYFYLYLNAQFNLFFEGNYVYNQVISFRCCHLRHTVRNQAQTADTGSSNVIIAIERRGEETLKPEGA